MSAFEDLEKLWKCFHATTWIADSEPGTAISVKIVRTQKCQAHGKTVISVRIDFVNLGLFQVFDLRNNGQTILPFLDILSELPELFCHSGDSVGFLSSRVSDTMNESLLAYERRKCVKREERVGGLGEIIVDGNLVLRSEKLESHTAGFGRSVFSAEFFQNIEKGGVALEAFFGIWKVFDRDRAFGCNR